MGRSGDSLDGFLERTGMHHRAMDMGRYCGIFLDEMERGLRGEPSSLGMIPTYIEAARAVPVGENVIALDAGGTNLRVAVVSFDASGKPVVEGLAKHRMPGSDGEMGKEDFFRSLAAFVAPVAGKAGKIGFCFSYPAEMTPEKDGRLIFFSKEVKARGVEGQMIGRNLARALSLQGAGDAPRIILLNDTVATLLAGRNSMPGRVFDGFVGLVCGTGLNVAYVEANSEVKKAPGLDPAGSQIINVESGGFAKGPAGEVDGEFNATTESPGRYPNEKMISGAYLGGLVLTLAKRAARDGCLSPRAGRELDALGSLSTKSVSDFLLSPVGESNPLSRLCAGIPEEDARTLYRLADAMVERAAKLVAVDLCAVLLKTGKGRDPRFPVCVTVDGTTFWQLKDYRTRVECHMRSFLTGENERHYEIAAAEDAPLIGAAIAGLTN